MNAPRLRTEIDLNYFEHFVKPGFHIVGYIGFHIVGYIGFHIVGYIGFNMVLIFYNSRVFIYMYLGCINIRVVLEFAQTVGVRN